MTYRRQSDWRFTSMKKSRIRAVLFVSAFLMFLFLMDYPYLSRLYNDQIAGDVIAVLARNEIPEDCEKRLTRAREYNRFLAGECCIPGEDCIAGEGGITGENDTAGENRTTAAASDSLHTGWMAAARVLCLEENTCRLDPDKRARTDPSLIHRNRRGSTHKRRGYTGRKQPAGWRGGYAYLYLSAQRSA